MSDEHDDLRARMRAAHDRAQRLEERADEAKVRSLLVRAEHLLIQHSPVVEGRLRLLLEDGEALPSRTDPPSGP
ncbi:hypothetical protein EV188_115105 [Actinomycetospora succinea]|uniref:Uncharacterized protein n=1 Tax=Actinomycetospora succinea TaxID=663603 RepID=A0A4R6UIT8_9PSEU|nr:hypothetical protein [Actinomycetospora succinea]TDQ46731.1 hypothetical protein EV188_115105 [Actinomycetospora succinea]